MNSGDLVKIRGKECGIILIPSQTKNYLTRQIKTLNLVETITGTVKALRDDEIEPWSGEVISQDIIEKEE